MLFIIINIASPSSHCLLSIISITRVTVLVMSTICRIYLSPGNLQRNNPNLAFLRLYHLTEIHHIKSTITFMDQIQHPQITSLNLWEEVILIVLAWSGWIVPWLEHNMSKKLNRLVSFCINCEDFTLLGGGGFFSPRVITVPWVAQWELVGCPCV